MENSMVAEIDNALGYLVDVEATGGGVTCDPRKMLRRAAAEIQRLEQEVDMLKWEQARPN